jgi:hypothetical protein
VTNAHGCRILYTVWPPISEVLLSQLTPDRLVIEVPEEGNRTRPTSYPHDRRPLMFLPLDQISPASSRPYGRHMESISGSRPEVKLSRGRSLASVSSALKSIISALWCNRISFFVLLCMRVDHCPASTVGRNRAQVILRMNLQIAPEDIPSWPPLTRVSHLVHIGLWSSPIKSSQLVHPEDHVPLRKTTIHSLEDDSSGDVGAIGWIYPVSRLLREGWTYAWG